MDSNLANKIRKLLNLSKSSNVHEAAAAAEAAQRLMTAHKLEMSDVEIKVEAEEAIVSEEILSRLGQRQAQSWQVYLMSGCAHSNGCRITIRKSRPSYPGGISVWGAKADVDTAIYLFMALQNEIKRLADAWGAANGAASRERNSFRVGAAVEIAGRLRAGRSAQMAETERNHGTSTALVHMRAIEKRTEDFIADRFKGTWKGGAGTSGSGYEAGKRAGAGVSLGGGARQIGASPKRLGS